MVKIYEDESLDDLLYKGLKIIQKKKGFRFSLDALLLAHFVDLKAGSKIIDLGTGTGIIPLLLALREKDLEILAVEYQKEQAEMARRSVAYNGLENIEVIQGDFLKLKTSYHNQFDLVLSNPPYYKLNSGRINPDRSIALARHEILCSLEDLVFKASKLLRDKASFYFIHRAERLGEIVLALSENKLHLERLQFVHPREDKEANLVLIEAKKGREQGVKIEKPLLVYDQDGEYRQELLEYFYGGEEND